MIPLGKELGLYPDGALFGMVLNPKHPLRTFFPGTRGCSGKGALPLQKVASIELIATSGSKKGNGGFFNQGLVGVSDFSMGLRMGRYPRMAGGWKPGQGNFSRRPPPLASTDRKSAWISTSDLCQARSDRKRHVQVAVAQQGSLHYTPEHCLVNGGFPLFCWKKTCFKFGRHVSFKEPCSKKCSNMLWMVANPGCEFTECRAQGSDTERDFLTVEKGKKRSPKYT